VIHYINGLILSLRLIGAALFGALGLMSGASFIIHLGGFVGWFAGLWFIIGSMVIIALPFITRVRLYDENY
jgi:hypothetical protein